MNATHPDSGFTQYNVHSLFGHVQSKATYKSLTEGKNGLSDLADKRTLILSRSTFSGTGQYASHWTGENYRTFEDMRYSIASLMNFNMFGIPHTGAEVCGFSACDPNAEVCYTEAEQQELCGRWMQLATFYPFAR